MQHSNQVNKSAMERLRKLAPKQPLMEAKEEDEKHQQKPKEVNKIPHTPGAANNPFNKDKKVDKKYYSKDKGENHMEESISYKDYFKARLMEGLMSEVFMTDAERATPEGQAMQMHHAGKVKGLIAKYNENPEQFKSVKAGDRLALMGRREGAITQIGGGLSDAPGKIVTPGSGEYAEIKSHTPVRFNTKLQVQRKEADESIKTERGVRLGIIRQQKAEAAKQKAIDDKNKSWTV